MLTVVAVNVFCGNDEGDDFSESESAGEEHSVTFPWSDAVDVINEGGLS